MIAPACAPQASEVPDPIENLTKKEGNQNAELSPENVPSGMCGVMPTTPEGPRAPRGL